MRWNVEVTAIDKTDSQTVVVEAESWQRALQGARAQRGESGPISGFSIELLDEGYRAVDPMARLRYTVRRAPDGAAADANASASAGANAPPIIPSPVISIVPSAPAAVPSPSSVAPPRPTASEAPPVPLVAEKPVAAAQPVEKAAVPSVPAPRSQSGPPPVPSKRAPQGRTLIGGSASSVESLVATVQAERAAKNAPPPIMHVEDASADATIRTRALDDLPTVPNAFTPPPAAGSFPVPHAPAEPVPPTQVIFKREHDPTETVPLTYREYVYAVARGVDEPSAERLLRAQLENVKTSMVHSRPGKFVNMAVFDVVFQGRPPVPPLATLMWKDWKGAPVVAFPRRPAAAVAPAPSFAPVAPAQPQVVAAPAPEPAFVPAPPPPAAVAPPVPAPSFPPPAVAAPAPQVSAPPVSVQAPPPVSVRDPFAPGTGPLPPGVPLPPTFSAPPPAISQAPTAPPLPPPALSQAPTAPPPPPPPPSSAPASQQPRQPSANISGAHGRFTPVPGRAQLKSFSSGRRHSGDELIADLFEAMGEIHYYPDAIDAGDFVLRLAMEMIPSRAAMVHLYDINTREFVVACAFGAQSSQLLLRRHAEGDPLLSAAMRKRRALVLTDAGAGDAAGAERYNLLGGAKSLIISPVMKGGRFLGALEVMNPNDGHPYTDNEGNALDYISEQFGEFLAEHGVVVDPERITRHPAAP